MKIGQKLSTAIVSIGSSLLLAGVLGAQQPQVEQKQQPAQRSKEGKAMEKMSMDDMMKQCTEHHQAAMKSIDQMSKTMEGAKQSNDPAKMRTAMDQAQKQLAQMKEHMTMCRNMMGMMEKMQGMEGMMKGGSK